MIRTAIIAIASALTLAVAPVWAGPIDMGSLSAPNAAFSLTTSGLFDGQWSIKLGSEQSAGFSITNVKLIFGPLTFNEVIGLTADVDGYSMGTLSAFIPNGVVTTLSLTKVLSAGTHYLHVLGDFGPQASLGGNFVATETQVSQVPEPATRDMVFAGSMILCVFNGLMRRRRRPA